MKYRVLWIAIFGVLFSCCCQAETKEDLRLYIESLAYQRGDRELPSKLSQLRKYCQIKNISDETMKNVLLDYAGRKGVKERDVKISGFALLMLRDMRNRDVLPIYSQKANKMIDQEDSNDGLSRRCAIAAIMRIGGKEALDLADKVLKDAQKYNSLDRFCVYEDLGNHLANTNAPETDKEFRQEIRKLFDKKIAEETDAAAVEQMDKALAAESSEYRASDRREALLKKHENTNLPYQKKYIQGALGKIRAEKKTVQ